MSNDANLQNDTDIKNFLLVAIFSLAGSAAMLGFQVMMGNPAVFSVNGLIMTAIAGAAAGSYSNRALKRGTSPVMWLITAPAYFAAVGFGIWATCLTALYGLTLMVENTPKVSFWSFLSGLFSHGYNYAVIGLLVGVVWALPVSLVVAIQHFLDNRNWQTAQPALAHK